MTNANAAARSHTTPVLDRLKAGRLFPTPEASLAALRAFLRFDATIGEAEADSCYPRWLEGTADTEDYAGQAPSREVQGRSAERVIADYDDGPLELHQPVRLHVPANDNFGALDAVTTSPSRAGRYMFDQAGIVIGYRLNKESMAGGDVWVSSHHPKFPDNVATPRHASGERSQATTALDTFDARSTVSWLKFRMSPEHFEAIYDATAGLGFGAIGEASGYKGKQAEAVGKDRVVCGLSRLVGLFAEYDQAGCT